jgi:hypothetical protein
MPPRVVAMADRPPKSVRQLRVNEQGCDEQVVRFEGESFVELKDRLAAAGVPGANVRVLLDDQWTVLLDGDELPFGDLQIRTADPSQTLFQEPPL